MSRGDRTQTGPPGGPGRTRGVDGASAQLLGASQALQRVTAIRSLDSCALVCDAGRWGQGRTLGDTRFTATELGATRGPLRQTRRVARAFGGSRGPLRWGSQAGGPSVGGSRGATLVGFPAAQDRGFGGREVANTRGPCTPRLQDVGGGPGVWPQSSEAFPDPGTRGID